MRTATERVRTGKETDRAETEARVDLAAAFRLAVRHDTFDALCYLERAARLQVQARATGRPLRSVRPEIVAATRERMGREEVVAATAHFAALRRILDREEPDYAG